MHINPDSYVTYNYYCVQIAKEEFEYVENFTLMDQRLAICTIACSFSGFALVYDYLYPFPASRMVLAMCAI